MYKLHQKLTAKSEKTLRQLEKAEQRIYEKQLTTTDSVTAARRLLTIKDKYRCFSDELRKYSSASSNHLREYLGHFDTLKTVFQFLDQKGITNVSNALSGMNDLERTLQHTEEIKQFIVDRREQLMQQLGQCGLLKDLRKFDKRCYYYREQIKEYTNTLQNPEKIEKKAIQLLMRTKVFQVFIKKSSILSTLFKMPNDLDDPSYVVSLAGLQTRAQINNLIQRQLASAGAAARRQFERQLQQAQSYFQQVKNRGKQSDPGAGEILPHGFKPNSQKSKSFLKRLECGTNVQTQSGQHYFPITSDIGLSVGYKLNDRSVVGVGGSFKLGWGHGWSNMRLSQEGAALRSYVDWKFKGSFWITGGFEMNYRTRFNSVAQLQNLKAWQQSSLVGLSKMLDMKNKFFKKTKLQLLWDVLSYQQMPRTQPLVFRVGYLFK